MVAAKEFAFPVRAGTKRPSFETADDSSRFSMREIRTGGATKNQLQGASLICCSLPRANSSLQLPFIDPGVSLKQIAIRHLGFSGSQENLSSEVFR